jgi:hypothetical protein
MSTSSQPTSYSITLNDTIEFSDTITLTSSMSTNTVTWSGLNGSTYTIGPSTIDTISVDMSTLTLPVEWKDCFPSWHKVEDMCKRYPGLEVALRNFQTVYTLVKDDYDTPTPKK